jgi:enterochelin esterase-like enzyme
VAATTTTTATPATTQDGTLDSRHLGRPTNWRISTPPNAKGVVICLHARGGDHRMAFDLGLPEAATALVIAAVDGGPDSYWHRRADGSDAMAMLLDEFVPLVDQRAGPLPRAIMGWSMGGYGALLAAERAPDQFKVVVAVSPALWTNASGTAPGAFDNAADYQRNDVWTHLERLQQLTVRVDCGTSDPFYPAARRLTAMMTFPHQANFTSGHHDADYWRSAAPGELTAIAAALR